MHASSYTRLQMATSCMNTAPAVLVDSETITLIEECDSEFYGVLEAPLNDFINPDSDNDEYLSPAEEEDDIIHSIGELGTCNSRTGSNSCDEEAAAVQGEFESGCGCQDNCYEQFSVEEIIDIRLNMKELDKRERDLFLMGKLQILINDPSTVHHARSSQSVSKKTATKSQVCL